MGQPKTLQITTAYKTMKDLRFRVWDEKNKRMIYSTDFNMFYEFFEQACFDEDKAMMYVGFKDKNGKEIWEGDKILIGRVEGFVEYIAGMFMVSYDDQTDSGPLGFLQTADMEVKGHIYES